MKFNEDTRVKIPTILHLVRLGYQYLSLKGQVWDENTNIFPHIFEPALQRINPQLEARDIRHVLEDISLALDNEDLGKAFYEKLLARSGIRLIDVENFNNNTFHVVTELTYKNGDDEFRPDITLLINGMPLVFIEVKKPNNREGVLAERQRINQRFANKNFRRFINITQFMIFSNNMEYDDMQTQPIQGAFYANTSYNLPDFNYFREEIGFNLTALLKNLTDENEIDILKDNNSEVIRYNPEFITNKDPNRPTNRICTSLLSRERLAFILQYGLAYVSNKNGIQKHIMRYPQLFATQAIQKTLDNGIKKGVIWHTQGSGKTALAFYNVRFLTDYFQKKNIIPKFYFIVDRLDLLAQAQREFTARGLRVHIINSRDEFIKNIRLNQVIHNNAGEPEITVVNIQKFIEDPNVVSDKDYNLNIQRIYFLDEVHRSYNPKGSFLANLAQSDRNAIQIGLTGTPLIGDDNNTRLLFGDYIHKYYYNLSIADGYTLRLIREEIATNYKSSLKKALEEIEVQQGSIDKKAIFSHIGFVTPMLKYIINDFENSRGLLNDSSIGAMVICDSADQARMMFKVFNTEYLATDESIPMSDHQPAKLYYAAEPTIEYKTEKALKNKVKSAALILHDEGDTSERKQKIDLFKEGGIDLLFVYNMLLTGFDAPRLKKLYMGRIIRQHGLLQALTRVNRTYNHFRYGYVVDFADIRKEFDETNKAYFDELQSELGNEMEHYSNLFKSDSEIQEEIEHIKESLFHFNIENAEIFSQQINDINDKSLIISLKKALADARSLYHLIRLQGNYQFLDNLDFERLNYLFREVSNRLDLLNLKENLEQNSDSINLLNIALEDILFKFTKVSEEELILADKLKNTLRRTRESLAGNLDMDDPKFITLKEELERLFKNKNLSEVTQEDMNHNIGALNSIYDRIKELNRENSQLCDKYSGDVKYMRLHKRLKERGDISATESKIFSAFSGVKQQVDHLILENSQIISNESYFENVILKEVYHGFVEQQNFKLSVEAVKDINHLLVNEYLKEFNNGVIRW